MTLFEIKLLGTALLALVIYARPRWIVRGVIARVDDVVVRGSMGSISRANGALRTVYAAHVRAKLPAWSYTQAHAYSQDVIARLDESDYQEDGRPPSANGAGERATYRAMAELRHQGEAKGSGRDPLAGLHVGVATDSESLERAIARNERLRVSLVRLFGDRHDAREVWFDRGVLQAEFRGNQKRNEDALKLFVRVVKGLEEIAPSVDLSDDHQGTKLRVFDSVLKGFWFYSVVSLGQWFDWHPTYVNRELGIATYISATVLAAYAFRALVRKRLAHTKRRDEFDLPWMMTGVIMAFPFAYGLVLDFDRELDFRKPLSVYEVVRSKDTVERPVQSRSRVTDYHVCFDPPALAKSADVGLSQCRELDHDLFDKLYVGDVVETRIGQGALGLRWFGSTRVLER